MLKKYIAGLCLSSFSLCLFAGEGMWIPILLKQLNEKDMQSKGIEIVSRGYL